MNESDDLVGYPKLAEWLGTSVDAVRKMRSRHSDFPEPITRKGTSPRWRLDQREDVVIWQARRPGKGYRR